MMGTDLVTDYLVIGAGISGLAFVDELLTRGNASITIVDKRDAPGGHWNDAYPFVKLHQPSTFYGVQSMELTKYRIDQHGLNKGFLSLATGPEIVSYCHALMRDRLIPSGRVTYMPATEYLSDGSLRGILSGKRTTVTVQKKLVDASWYTNEIPLHHKPSFDIDASVTCIPPNHLPALANKFQYYTILGGGKTAIDSCLWLISNGVDPERLRWIIPRDFWYFNRARFQTGPEFFVPVFNSLIERMNIIGSAESAVEYAHHMEKAGIWLRLDPNIDADRFHAAIISTRELEELRKIKDTVRKGHVTKLGTSKIQFTAGSVDVLPNTLYVDCTASAIKYRPPVPVYQPGKITLQMIRFPQIPFSSAIIAFLETLPMTDAERNKYTKPVAFNNTVEAYVSNLPADLSNQVTMSKNPQVRDWIKNSRLDGFSPLASSVKPHETEKVEIMKRFRQASLKAYENVARLAASTKSHAKL